MGDVADAEPNYPGSIAVKKSPVTKKVMDILTWQNVQVSGGIFAAGLVWFLMTTWGGYSVLSFASILLILHLVASIMKNYFMAFWAQETSKQAPEIDVDAFKKTAETLANELNLYLQWYWNLLGAANLMATLQVVGVLLITWTVGSWFDAYTLCFLVFLFAFSVPFVYHANKKLCDDKINMIKTHLETAVAKGKAHIPRAGKAEDGKKST